MALNKEQKEYYQKLAQEAGFDDARTQQFLEVLDNEKIGQGIVPRPEFSRGLDQERARAAAARKPLEDRIKYIETDWLPKAQDAHARNLAGLEKLRLYEATYGQVQPGQNTAPASAATGLSEEKINQLVQERMNEALAVRDRGYLEFDEIKDMHRETFGKRLPVSEFETFVEQQRQSGQFQGLRSAYNTFVAEDRKQLEEKRISDEVNRQVSEKLRDYQSQHHIPSDPRPSEPHLIHDSDRLRKEAQESSGKDAFLETMRAQDGSWKEQQQS